jgi:hypothetical protein
VLPSHYFCTACRETFTFKFRGVRRHVGEAPLGDHVPEERLLSMPVRPAWCKDCAALCLVEDIAPVRAFEDAYGAARAGKPVEYPVDTEFMNAADAEKELAGQLRWRMARRHAPRALCCGGSNYQCMDEAQPLLKHAGCEFGFIEQAYSIEPGGRRPGVFSPANIRAYGPEGELIGLLTWYSREDRTWEVDAASYPPAPDDA